MEDRFNYPVILEPEADGGYVVSFPDIPEALTSGANRKEALAMAVDCLAEAIAGRIDDSEDIPMPSKVAAKGLAVALPVQMALKAWLYVSMQEADMSNVALAKKIHVHEREVRRILDPHHGTKLPTIEQAFKALGKHIRLQVV